jgi:hypothetical protein
VTKPSWSIPSERCDIPPMAETKSGRWIKIVSMFSTRFGARILHSSPARVACSWRTFLHQVSVAVDAPLQHAEVSRG